VLKLYFTFTHNRSIRHGNRVVYLLLNLGIIRVVDEVYSPNAAEQSEREDNKMCAVVRLDSNES